MNTYNSKNKNGKIIIKKKKYEIFNKIIIKKTYFVFKSKI